MTKYKCCDHCTLEWSDEEGEMVCIDGNDNHTSPCPDGCPPEVVE